jgi:simple sugar transport system permease protein
MEFLDQFTVTTLRGATPIVLAAVAGLFAIRAGIFHLGIEGLMLVGAFTAVAAGTASGSATVGMLAAILVCLILSMLYWFLIDKLKADTVIAGLGLTALCVGGTAFAMQVLFNQRGQMASSVRLYRPVTGPQEGALSFVSELTIITWVTPLLIVLAWIVLRRSRLGLQIAAVGDYPYGAKAVGVNQSRVRLYALLITGAGCAIAGTQLAIGDVAGFSENMTNGRGFFALAAMLFGGFSAVFTALAGLFFGFADAFGIFMQINDTSGLPVQFVLMVPFILTILIVSLSGYLRKKKSNP